MSKKLSVYFLLTTLTLVSFSAHAMKNCKLSFDRETNTCTLSYEYQGDRSIKLGYNTHDSCCKAKGVGCNVTNEQECLQGSIGTNGDSFEQYLRSEELDNDR